MSEMNKYSASDLIYLFLDGKTDSQQKKMLFSSLADDSVLQSEFQDALNINTAFRTDKEDVRPSAALTAAVFSSAGFSSPFSNPAADAPQPVPVPAAKTDFWSRLMPRLSNPFVSGALCTLATAAIFIFLLNPLVMVHDQSPAASVQAGKTQLQSNNNINKDIPVVTSQENSLTQNNTKTVYKDKIRYIVITKEAANDSPNQAPAGTEAQAQPTAPGQIVAVLTPADIIPNNYMASSFTQMPGSGSFSPIPGNAAQYRPEFAGTGIDGSVEFHLVSNLAYMGKHDIDPRHESIGNNLRLGALLNIGKNSAIGLEGGKESFQMYFVSLADSISFIKVESKGKTISVPDTQKVMKYDKIPSALWAGLKYKYTFNEFKPFANVSPFVSATGAYVSDIGLMIRPGLGLVYNPENTFYFSLGFEYSALFYQKNNSIQSPASKLSFFYNMGYRF